MASELEDVHGELEKVKKQKGNSDKSSRALNEQLNEFRAKCSSLESQLQETEGKMAKHTSEAGELNKLLEESEHKLGLATKNNKSLESALNDAKGSFEGESKVSDKFALMLLL